MNEQWRFDKKFTDYRISDHGRVFNERKGRSIPTRLNKEGFLMVSLADYGQPQETRSVGRMVAKLYLDPPPFDSYNSIIHLNGDRSDCRASNIMWRPRWFATKYHQQFNDLPYRVSVFIPHINRKFDSLREFCTTYGLIEQDTFVDMLNGSGCWLYGWKVVENTKNV